MSKKGGNQTAPKTVSVSVMGQITKHTGAIKEKVINHNKATKELQVKHTFNVLKQEVWATMSFLAQCINQKQLEHDPTGLLNCNSSFQDPVNQLAKEWLVKYDAGNKNAEVPPSAKLIIANAAGAPQGMIGKIYYTLKSGVKIVYDAAKKCLTFIWGKIVQAYNWVKGVLIDIYEWIKTQCITFYNWCVSKLGKKDAPDINVNQLLEEGKTEYVPIFEPEGAANGNGIVPDVITKTEAPVNAATPDATISTVAA